MTSQNSKTYKLLVVDDEDAVHRSYASVLTTAAKPSSDEDLIALEAALFGAQDVQQPFGFTISACKQGDDAVDLVQQSVALAKDCRFSVVFIDMRMPPGMHGMEAANRIHEVDPDIKIVIVTGYSDFTMDQIEMAFPPSADVYYVQKPFDGNAIWTLASALSKDWDGQQLTDTEDQIVVSRFKVRRDAAA